jgi:hypothetical protein
LEFSKIIVAAKQNPNHKARSSRLQQPWGVCTVEGLYHSSILNPIIHLNFIVFSLQQSTFFFIWIVSIFDFSKGISSSALPYKRSTASWQKITTQDVIFFYELTFFCDYWFIMFFFFNGLIKLKKNAIFLLDL